MTPYAYGRLATLEQAIRALGYTAEQVEVLPVSADKCVAEYRDFTAEVMVHDPGADHGAIRRLCHAHETGVDQNGPTADEMFVVWLDWTPACKAALVERLRGPIAEAVALSGKNPARVGGTRWLVKRHSREVGLLVYHGRKLAMGQAMGLTTAAFIIGTDGGYC